MSEQSLQVLRTIKLSKHCVSHLRDLPSTQARFRTSNNRTVEAVYHSDTRILKETQS